MLWVCYDGHNWLSLSREMDVLHQKNWTNEVTEKLKEFEKSLLIALKEEGWDGSEDPEQVIVGLIR